MSVTSSRLAALIGDHKKCLVLWDWKSGQVLFVCQSSRNSTNPTQALVQELEGGHFSHLEFIDDYRLLISCGSTKHTPPSLVLMDTTKFVGGAPTQTVFQLSPDFINSGFLSLLLERGVHNPSLAEALAPFHQDPSQRIVVLCPRFFSYYLVLRVGALLDFLGSHEGAEVGWDGWKRRVFTPSNIDRPENTCIWISGCRLFSLYSTDTGPEVRVHDFSMRGGVNYLRKQAFGSLAGIRCLPSTGVRAQIQLDRVSSMHSSHDSLIFSGVSVFVLFYLPWSWN